MSLPESGYRAGLFCKSAALPYWQGNAADLRTRSALRLLWTNDLDKSSKAGVAPTPAVVVCGSSGGNTTNLNDGAQPSDSGAGVSGRTADLRNGGLRYACSTHGQRKRHTMAQGRRARTRGARYRQRVGSGGCSGVRRRPRRHLSLRRILPAPESATIPRRAGPWWTAIGSRRVGSGARWPMPSTQEPRRASTDLSRPGDRGGAGGSGRERGALTRRGGRRNGDRDIGRRTPAVTGFGETVQVASEGAPVQVKLTLPDNPPSPPTLKV